ncbi:MULTISPECIES: hypothetical protein [Aequorivita]|uniref:Uncharacterized protein n=1 Tax=Aequorivita iocasae TaxID=2803865 RepID=A0ABX7DMP0_9FLAO|nr:MULTISPECIES: hypothetical protein [Aequorivita]QQX75290.1 hypothetical protein JK629_07940 [Aequorivita iocasae]UCA54739.1 hypothetical protein LDL78_07985 [Aequorivita sp. F7]
MINAKPELFGVKPIEFIIDFESEAFVEIAGNHYLFKVGELIGPPNATVSGNGAQTALGR